MPTLATGPTTTQRPRGLKAALGVLVAAVGLISLGGLQFVMDDVSSSSEKIVFALGLGLMALLWAAAQCLVLIGAAMVWDAFRPRPWRG